MKRYGMKRSPLEQPYSVVVGRARKGFLSSRIQALQVSYKKRKNFEITTLQPYTFYRSIFSHYFTIDHNPGDDTAGVQFYDPVSDPEGRLSDPVDDSAFRSTTQSAPPIWRGNR
ncbi:hypothetical protein CHS0354_040483 [Potamilus streckersoni]|uniref:Uncharacterized protein n=1 Tax=Potamilus streckersoni TaxID=2493646 RepID=A0AAE0TLL2_9BIVA|nr:hypothetical protein CHS0354_040483 [Potamilus streckersoni]